MTDGPIDFVTGAPATGSLDVVWTHGARSRRKGRARDPRIQVHHYDEHTVVLRQNMSVSFEAPFLFLLFGNDRALLLDTGATADPGLFPLRETVDGLVAAWLDAHPREGYELVVAHSHGHGDHVAGDAQFADRPATTVVPRDADAVRSFFGFGSGFGFGFGSGSNSGSGSGSGSGSNSGSGSGSGSGSDEDWAGRTVRFDLGGRVLEILGSPGHHKAAVSVYDPWSGILLTGDTVLPGRLFAFDFAAYLATLDHLVAFAATRPVTHVLGCHVEMADEPGRVYPQGSLHHPHERAPEMPPGHLTTVRDTAASVAGTPGVHRFDDFVIYNEPGKGALIGLMAHGLAMRLRGAVFGH